MANRALLLNFCPVPNVILDQIMRKVSHAEFKVLMIVVRQTYGWRKQTDRISLSQLVEMTGVSERKVIDSLRSLDWLILSHKTPYHATEYSLNLDVKGAAIADPLPPSPELTSGVSPELAAPLDPKSPELTSDTKDREKDIRKDNKRGKPLSSPLLTLPEWIDVETWTDFLDHRKKIRKPMTPKAMDLAIKALDKLRKAGNNPTAVMEQSILRSWAGVFPLPAQEQEVVSSIPDAKDVQARYQRRKR